MPVTSSDRRAGATLLELLLVLTVLGIIALVSVAGGGRRVPGTFAADSLHLFMAETRLEAKRNRRQVSSWSVIGGSVVQVSAWPDGRLAVDSAQSALSEALPDAEVRR
jgi:prepilin-type N-terminal cleavage/methylation domain-containing protein